MKIKEITLQDIASYPMITYDYAFTGSTIVSEVFKEANISPNIMLTAIDADVIKTYVELGLGVGLIAEMAYDKNKDSALESRDVSYLFPTSTTFIGIRKKTFVRGFTYDFIKMFTPDIKDSELRNFLTKKNI
jgi:LysR family cys regulon transcriptional activator